LKLFGSNPKTVHYYYEIVRFWNKINFIINRTSLDSTLHSEIKLAKEFYAIYRIFWEKASNETILRELKNIDRFFLKKIRQFSWKKALAGKTETEKLSICEGVPTFMINHLLPVMKLEFLKENIKYMDNSINDGITYLRFNILKRKYPLKNIISQIKEELKKKNIRFNEDTHIPYLINIPIRMKSKVIQNYWYQNSYLVFQDKASVAVVQALSPQPGELICDMCAAPGSKTSLMAQSMKNKGHIIAGDFMFNRIKTMKKLLKNLNVLNTYLINIDSIKFPVRFKNYFDRILLDAPCTGNGTFSVNPELKWRQNVKFLHQCTLLQEKLFESALYLLKHDGILVYSTCSLYPEEGEYLISKFIDRLEPLDLPHWFSPSYTLNNSILPGTGRLFPSIHHTQGFFIGKFKKKEK
jgi:16S rRNA C967 or C1407 C5-methylase (RsmB/RsmF family)